MRIFIITFRSVTFAQRGERLLNRNNHRCVLQRTPKWMEQQGCGYSLRIKTEDIIPWWSFCGRTASLCAKFMPSARTEIWRS